MVLLILFGFVAQAVLADESWESCSARMHGDGLAALRAAKKSRAGWRAAGQAVMLFALLGAVWWTFKGDGSQQRGQNVSVNLSYWWGRTAGRGLAGQKRVWREECRAPWR